MTMGAFGQVLPIQRNMMMLAGLYIGFSEYDERSDEDVAKWIEIGRRELAHKAGVDFGYDLFAWHNYLITHSEFSNDYTYSDSETRHFYDDILNAQTNLRRVKVVEQLMGS